MEWGDRLAQFQDHREAHYVNISNAPIIISKWGTCLLVFSIGQFDKTFGSLEETRKGLDYFREEVKKAGFPGLHVQLMTGGVPNADFLKQIEMLGINSLTLYNWGGPHPEDYIQWGKEAFERLEKWSEAVSIPYFPNASIGWDDTPRFPHKTQKDVVHFNQSPEAFAAFLQKAKGVL